MTHDFIVVGAGSTGSSIINSLSSFSKDVVLVDGNGVANGNTGKSSALVRTHYSNPIVAKMAMYSQKIFSNFQSIGYSGFTKTGMLYGFEESSIYNEEKNLSMLRELGGAFNYIDVKLLSKFYPSIITDNIDLVVHEPEGGYADPVATSNSFVSRARENGAKTMLNNQVMRIGNDQEGSYIELNECKKIYGKKIILATNIWTNRLLENSGLEERDHLPIMPTLHSVIYLRRPPKMHGVKPTYWDMSNLAYYKMEGETITAIGSLDPEMDRHECQIDDGNYDGASDEYIENYLNKVSSRVPLMNAASIISTISGKYDMTPDGHPIIDSLDDLGFKGFYTCVGLSGHGFKLSPALGLIILEMMKGVESEKRTFDWEIFRIKRFSEGAKVGRLHENIGTLY